MERERPTSNAGLPLRHASRATSPKQGRSTLGLIAGVIMNVECGNARMAELQSSPFGLRPDKGALRS